MPPEEVRRRIALGEDSRTEFKREAIASDDLAAALVAFANTEGGDIFFGIDDDGTVRGVKDVDALCRQVDDGAIQGVEPRLTVTYEKLVLDGGPILVVHVPRGPGRPYRTSKGRHYVRSGSRRRDATRQELLDLYQSAGAFFPDETVVADTGPGDLDPVYLRDRRPDAIDERGNLDPAALRGMRILGEGGLTLGGLLCFGRDPQAHRTHARVTAIRFPGSEVSERFLDSHELGGTLERQYRDAEAFVRRHIPVPDAVLGPPPPHAFPIEAALEALVNALVHRDYLAPAQTRVFLFDDRIEVRSPGRLLNTVTVEAMRYGCHVVRNPVVFAYLARLRLARDAGIGVPNMFRLMRAAGLPDPEIRPIGGEIAVTLWRVPRAPG